MKKDAKYYIQKIEKLALDSNYQPHDLYQEYKKYSSYINDYSFDNIIDVIRLDKNQLWVDDKDLIFKLINTYQSMLDAIKKENPNMKKTRKNNPNYLTEKKLDELETKKEFETERTLLDYVKHFEGLTEHDVDAIMAIIGKGTRAETKKRLESILKYSASLIPHYSIVDRLTKHRGRWSYTPGQSGTEEIARLRKIILTETGKKPNPSKAGPWARSNIVFENDEYRIIKQDSSHYADSPSYWVQEKRGVKQLPDGVIWWDIGDEFDSKDDAMNFALKSMKKYNPTESEHKKILNDLFELAKRNVRGTKNEENLFDAHKTNDSSVLDRIILATLDPRVRDYAIYKKSMMMDHRLDKKNNPNYLKEKFNNLEKIKKLVDSGYKVYTSNYNKFYDKSNIEKALLDSKAFITSDLFRYTDYGGAYTIAKANILEIESRYPKLIEDELIEVYSTAHNGQNMEFKFDALNDENLYEDLLSLKDYPVLDDGALSEVEMELEDECWNSYGRDDWKDALIKKYGEAAENLTDEDLDNLAYEASQYTCCGRGEVQNMEFSFDIKGMIDSLDKFDKGKKLAKKENPIPKCENPSWAVDEDIWEKAKKQSQKSYGKISYPFVVYLYKQMGGKVKKKK